jgi:hypothetical protein
MHPTTRLLVRLTLVGTVAYGLGMITGQWVDLFVKGALP